MSGFGRGEVFPTWEQLLGGIGSVPETRPVGNPRHARTGALSPLVDDAMSWRKATAWSALAASCALAVSRWAPHFFG